MATKKQQEAFNKNVHDLIIRMGAVTNDSEIYKYSIGTKAGTLYINTDEPERGEVFSIYARFESPAKAKPIVDVFEWGRLNEFSGKWNYHGYEANELLELFATNLRRIVN